MSAAAELGAERVSTGRGLESRNSRSSVTNDVRGHVDLCRKVV